MAFALLTHTAAASANTQNVTSPAIDTSGANFLVVGAHWYRPGGTPSGISDSKGNTWTQLNVYGSTGLDNSAACIWYCTPTSVGSGHTCSVNGTAVIYPSITVASFSGAATSSVFDVQNGASIDNWNPDLQTGSVTPGQVNELLISINTVNGATTVSVDSGFTISDTQAYGSGANMGGSMAYLIETAVLAKNPTWHATTTGFSAAVAIATFKASVQVQVAYPISDISAGGWTGWVA